MCVAGGKRCEYSDAISNVRKKARSKLKGKTHYLEQEVSQAVREFQENNPEMVATHLPEKMGFQTVPPSRTVPQSLLNLMGDKKATVTGPSAEDQPLVYKNLFKRREEWLASLNEDEADGVHAYAMDAFEAMNLHLRRRGYAGWAKQHAYLYASKDRGGTAEGYLETIVKPRIAGLDSALKKAVPPDGPEKLYRFFRVPAGVNPQDYIKRYLKVGGGFKDRGFMSTTADPEFLTAHVMDRSGGTRNKGYVVLEMLSSAGASLQPDDEPYWGKVQSLEAEVLIPRNTGFRIVETGVRKFEFAQDRKDLAAKLGSWNSNFKVNCDEGSGLKLPVVRMIDESLVRAFSTEK